MNPKYYPWLFVAFFAVVLAMNVVMLYFATTTFNGLAVENAYEKGLEYNDTLNQIEKQKESKIWLKDKSAFDFKENNYKFKLALFHKADPLLGAEVVATAFRPTQQGYDQTIVLKEENGIYVGKFAPPLPGLWELRYQVNIKNPAEVINFKKRVDLR